MDQVQELSDALPMPKQPSFHVEINQCGCSTVRRQSVKEAVAKFLSGVQSIHGDMCFIEFIDEFLKEHVKSVSIISDTDCFSKYGQGADLSNSSLQFYVYQLHDGGPSSEELEDDISAANHWLLPAEEFHGLWESLLFDSDVKTQLLQYAATTLLFSDRGVDNNIISWNKVVLLHGPPGTGKTSLCKALAQKLSIRLSNRFSFGQLIEINSHSLFSKWFSESGKLVMKMFQKIQELIEDNQALVCVLIDEVESLTAARKSALNGQEPSDAIRVVNAFLTQIDQIKRYPNVIILTTSNITGAIDLAFVDRADIKQYIGPPSRKAIYKIYHSCIKELVRTSIISPATQILDLRALEVLRFVDNDVTHCSLKLKKIADKSFKLSGRTLRKLPFLAHALYSKSQAVCLDEFLDSLSVVVDKQFEEKGNLCVVDEEKTQAVCNGIA